MSAAHRVIRHPSELGGLSVLPPRRRLKLDLEGLPEGERKNWEKRLNRAYRAGGIREALVGFGIGLILGLLFLAYAMSDRRLGTTGATIVLLALIVPPLLGEVIGLLRSQLRLRRLVSTFQAQWAEGDFAMAEGEAA